MALPDLEAPLRGPKFDWTVNLGHVLTIAAILVAMGTAYSTYQVTMTDHDNRIRALEKQGMILDGRTTDVYNVLYGIKQDVAIIKDRIERDGKK